MENKNEFTGLLNYLSSDLYFSDRNLGKFSTIFQIFEMYSLTYLKIEPSFCHNLFELEYKLH